MTIRRNGFTGSGLVLHPRSLYMAVRPFPTLLYVTDFSESSMHALPWAISEALKHGLHVSVLCPYRLDQMRKKDNVVQSKKELEAEALNMFERLVSGPLRESKVTFDFRSEVGFLRDRIAESIRKHHVVMLVMGSTMADDESLTELIGEVEVPVVIVPFKKA